MNTVNKSNQKIAAFAENSGVIQHMNIPESWIETYRKGVFSVRKFSHPRNFLVSLNIIYRGIPLGEYAADYFHDLLTNDIEEVTHAQLIEMPELLVDLLSSGQFGLLSAYTRDWNGKTVLIVEGVWNGADILEFHMFIPGKTPGFVEEICYVAPSKEYYENLGLMRKCLQSIEWF